MLQVNFKTIKNNEHMLDGQMIVHLLLASFNEYNFLHRRVQLILAFLMGVLILLIQRKPNSCNKSEYILNSLSEMKLEWEAKI